MENISYNDFQKKAEQLFALCPHYRVIILEILRRMEKKHELIFQNRFKETFQELKKDLSITYENLAQLLTEKYGIRIDVNTLKSYNRKERKSLTSSYSPEIAEIFGVYEKELIYGKDYYPTLSKANCEIENMFNRLSQENQNAVYYLVSAIYMEKIAPEIFESELYEDHP